MKKSVDAFEKKLVSAGIEVACNKIGIDFNSTFIKPSIEYQNNPYAEYDLVVFPHSIEGLLGGVVIHAIPLALHKVQFPWEEWFVLNGKQYHQVLYLHKHKNSTHEVFISKSDKDHPVVTRNNKWYYHKASSMTPILFENKKKKGL